MNTTVQQGEAVKDEQEQGAGRVGLYVKPGTRHRLNILAAKWDVTQDAVIAALLSAHETGQVSPQK